MLWCAWSYLSDGAVVHGNERDRVLGGRHGNGEWRHGDVTPRDGGVTWQRYGTDDWVIDVVLSAIVLADVERLKADNGQRVECMATHNTCR